MVYTYLKDVIRDGLTLAPHICFKQGGIKPLESYIVIMRVVWGGMLHAMLLSLDGVSLEVG